MIDLIFNKQQELEKHKIITLQLFSLREQHFPFRGPGLRFKPYP